MKIWTYTFGCKVNQYETELLRHRMMSPSDSVAATISDADVCLINTCSVTSFADKEARQMIRRVLRENPNARTIVTGCYATRAPKEITEISPRLEVYSNLEKESLPSCVGYEVSNKPLGIHHFAGRTRAFLKIQDGCKAPCNYCIIPTVRPDMWNKPVHRVVAEFKALIENGYQEVVLTGIRLGLYRGLDEDHQPHNLINLLEKLTQLSGRFRIRLSSLEVTEVSDRLLEFVQQNPKVCRHFHIPMQSGNTEVLKAMDRWYSADYYHSRVRAVRHLMPDCGVTADVMVGYPTETDEQFLSTKQRILDMELSGLHVFRFSAREGTKAALLKPLDPQIIIHRAHQLGEVDQYLREQFYRRHEGSQREVLPESGGEGWTDNYIRVDTPITDEAVGLGKRFVLSKTYSKMLQASVC